MVTYEIICRQFFSLLSTYTIVPTVCKGVDICDSSHSNFVLSHSKYSLPFLSAGILPAYLLAACLRSIVCRQRWYGNHGERVKRQRGGGETLAGLKLPMPEFKIQIGAAPGSVLSTLQSPLSLSLSLRRPPDRELISIFKLE